MLNKFLISSLFITSSWIVLSDARAMREEDPQLFKITAPQLSEGLEKKKITLNGKDFMILSKFDLGSAKKFCEKNPKKTFTAIKKDKNTFKLSYIKEKSAIFKLTFQKKNDNIVNEGKNLGIDYKQHAGFKKSIEKYAKKHSHSTRNEDTKNDNMTPLQALRVFYEEGAGYGWIKKYCQLDKYIHSVTNDYKDHRKHDGHSILKTYFLSGSLNKIDFSDKIYKTNLKNALHKAGEKILELRKKAKELGMDPRYGLHILTDLDDMSLPLTNQFLRAYCYLDSKNSDREDYKNKGPQSIEKEINTIIKIVNHYHKITGTESCNTPTDYQIDALLTFEGQLSNWSYPLIDHRFSDDWFTSSCNQKKAILTPSRISAAEYLGKCNIFPNDNYLSYVDAAVYALSKIDKPSQSEVKAVKHFWSSSFKIELPEPDQIKHLALIFDEGEKDPTVPQYNAVLYMKTHFPKEKIDLRKINLVAYVMGVGISQPLRPDFRAASCLIENLRIEKPSDKLILWTKEFREKFKKDPIKGQIPLGL